MVLICLAPLVCLWYMVMSLHLLKFGIFWGFCFYRYECMMNDFVTANRRKGYKYNCCDSRKVQAGNYQQRLIKSKDS